MRKLAIAAISALAASTGCLSTGTLPYTMPNNITSLNGIFTFANSVTGDLFGTLISGFAFIFMLLHFFSLGYAPAKAISGTCGIMLVISVLLWAMGIVGVNTLLFFLLGLLGSGLYLFLKH